jgi:DNA-directed RNA polymerase-3 subunit RPC5
MDEDDEVIREIDVFCSPALTSQLHLIQFPLQHKPVPLPEQARIRTKHGLMLELDQSLPANIGRDGDYFLQKRTHVSQTIPVSTHLALAKMIQSKDDKDALYLVPLEHILQMRPSFNHVDKSVSTDAAVDAEDDDQDAEPDAKERKPLMFQKKESERATIARQSSYAYKIACEESEEWQVLEVYGRDSAEYQQAYEQVLQGRKDGSRVPSLSSGEAESYIESLNYLPASSHGEDEMDLTSSPEQPTSKSTTEPPSQSQLMTRLVHKLTTLLHRGWPMPYSILSPQFLGTNDSDLLMALAHCAVLVRGNFVLQSRFLPLEKPKVRQARTFILYLLHSFGYVQRTRLDQVYKDTKVTPEWIEVLLQQVGKKSLNGWVLKLEDNHAFCEAYPEHARLHQQYWERQSIHFSESIKKYLA